MGLNALSAAGASGAMEDAGYFKLVSIGINFKHYDIGKTVTTHSYVPRTLPRRPA